MHAIAIVLGTGLCLMMAERLWPGRSLPKVPGFYLRGLLLNLVQAGVVFVAGVTFEDAISAVRPFSADSLGTVGGVAVGYLTITFVYYVWHRARHEVPLLWRWLHQLHHSPKRIEVWTSFYKHPAEAVANSLLSSAVLYLMCGVSPAVAAIVTSVTGVAELLYHMNIKTPHWLGYLFQRPEMHAVHHAEGWHRQNYSDLPLWDMLFGTYFNPHTAPPRCGLGDEEHRIKEMLLGVDVMADPTPSETATTTPGRTAASGGQKVTRYFAGVLLGVGLLQMVGNVFASTALKGLGAATGASPAPKVFTRMDDEREPFSSRFAVRYTDPAGALKTVELTAARYQKLQGPYNRRNAYGAMVAGAPILLESRLLEPLFTSISRYAVCDHAPLLRELGIAHDPRQPVTLVQRPRDQAGSEFLVVIRCTS